MQLYDNSLWIKDIDLISKSLPELDQLAGSSVLITGVSGLICSAIADVFFRYNDTHEKKIRILAAGRNEKRMRDRFDDMFDRDDFCFVFFDAASGKFQTDLHADYIIHGAGNAYPAKIVKEPVETMLGNFIGTKNLLEYAKGQGTKRFLYISSSEVYGQKAGNDPYKEDEYGYIDLLNPRNSYSVGKRAAETLCVSYAVEYGVESVIVRPGHIYGPTASPEDNRVSSAWAYAAARGEDIVMKSDGAQIRSYCYCLDCASAILKVLLRGTPSTAYNISNPDSVITIRKMAEILANSANVNIKTEQPDETDRRMSNPMLNSSLCSDDLLSIGWNCCFDAETGLDHTVKILASLQSE